MFCETYHTGINAHIDAEKAELALVDKVILFGTFGALDSLAVILGVVGSVLKGPNVARAESLEKILPRRLEVFALAGVRVL